MRPAIGGGGMMNIQPADSPVSSLPVHRRKRTAKKQPALNGAAHFLSLAAAPTFAGMALLTCLQDVDPSVVICAAGELSSPLDGMTIMYLLMSAVHLTPWLKTIARKRPLRRRSQ